MEHMTQKVLAMDLDNLTEEEHVWLHKMKNLAAVMQARLQLKHQKEELSMSEYGEVERRKMEAKIWRPTNRRQPQSDKRLVIGSLILAVISLAFFCLCIWRLR